MLARFELTLAAPLDDQQQRAAHDCTLLLGQQKRTRARRTVDDSPVQVQGLLPEFGAMVRVLTQARAGDPNIQHALARRATRLARARPRSTRACVPASRRPRCRRTACSTRSQLQWETPSTSSAARPASSRASSFSSFSSDGARAQMTATSDMPKRWHSDRTLRTLVGLHPMPRSTPRSRAGGSRPSWRCARSSAAFA